MTQSLTRARERYEAYGHRKDELGRIVTRDFVQAMKADLDKWCDEKAAERERMQDLGRVA